MTTIPFIIRCIWLSSCLLLISSAAQATNTTEEIATKILQNEQTYNKHTEFHLLLRGQRQQQRRSRELKKRDPSSAPSNAPTISEIPTQSPTKLCVDQPGWTDPGGDGCLWYASTPTNCAEYGDLYSTILPEHTANTACCTCGGGFVSQGNIPSKSPSAVPTLSMLPSVSPSDLPSVMPSDAPSDAPSVSPSDVPTNRPTVTSKPTNGGAFVDENDVVGNEGGDDGMLLGLSGGALIGVACGAGAVGALLAGVTYKYVVARGASSASSTKQAQVLVK